MATSTVDHRLPSGSLAEVVDLILDKGLVIDVYARLSLVGIELLTLDVRVVVASVDTYLHFAEATNRLDLRGQGERHDSDVEDLLRNTSGLTQGQAGSLLGGQQGQSQNGQQSQGQPQHQPQGQGQGQQQPQGQAQGQQQPPPPQQGQGQQPQPPQGPPPGQGQQPQPPQGPPPGQGQPPPPQQGQPQPQGQQQAYR